MKKTRPAKSSLPAGSRLPSESGPPASSALPAKSRLLDASTALPGFKRSPFRMEGRKQLVFTGLGLLFLSIVIFIYVPYQDLLLAYSIYAILLLMTYLTIWMDGASEMREPDVEMKRWPSVSIIIPSFNAGHTIFECLEHVRRIRYPGRVDVMVVDDGSTDGSAERLQKMKGISFFPITRNVSKSSAVNYGIAHAKGEIIACLDSDTYANADVLERAIPYFAQDKKIGSVVLFINAAHPRNILQRVQELEYWVSFGFYFKTVDYVDGLHVTPGPMALYRREVFAQLGGFDETNITEDLEIGLRMRQAGWRIKACHAAVVYTEVPSTLANLYKQRLRWFRGGLMNILRYNHLFLNPAFGALGMFTMPMVLTSGLFAAVFTVWTILNGARGAAIAILPALANLTAFLPVALRGPPLDPLMVNSVALVAAIPVLIWCFFLYSGFRIAGVRPDIGHVLPALILLFLYPAFLGITFLAAYASELSGRWYRW